MEQTIALENYLQFNRDNWEQFKWFRQVEKDFWRLYILQKEAEAELKYFTTKKTQNEY